MEYTPQEETALRINPTFLAVFITYFPFFGWMLPYIVRKDDSFWQGHAKQGFILAAFFITVSIFLNLINLLLPHEWIVFRLCTVTTIYIVYLLYFSFCAYCMRTSFKGEEAGIYFLQKIIKRFDF